MIWQKDEINKTVVKNIIKRYSLSPLEASLLYRRNLTSAEDIAFFLEKNLSFTHNPFLFKEMNKVVNRLKKAQEEQEKVLIFGDKDVDGITSTVIASSMLKSLKIAHETRIPKGDELYGLTEAIIEKAYEDKISLVITVDCGTSSHKSIERANELSIDVIVVDHHIAQDLSRVSALAIINPNIPDSGYPFPYLAGCGVISKVFWAVLFSQTPLYNRDFCFVHLEDSTIFLVHSLNGLLQNSLILDLKEKESLQKLGAFCQNKVMISLDKTLKERIIKFFKTPIDIELQNLEILIQSYLPKLKEISLKSLQKLSRKMLYQSETSSEFEKTLLFMNFLFQEILLMPHKSVFIPYEDILDLAAIGTLADMMPLKNENHILVKKGLKKASQTKNKGLQSLLSLKGLWGKNLKSHNISWEITPILNSAGRLGEAYRSLDLLLCQDSEETFEKAREIIALNRKRRSLEVKIWNSSLETLKNSFYENGKKFVLLYNADIPKGLTGILASRILKHFHVPAIVLSSCHNDLIKGSLRASKEFNAKEMLSYLKDILIDFGGHNSVAGFSLEKKNLDLFKTQIKTYMCNIAKASHKPPLKIDAFLPHDSFNPSLLKVVDRFEPFGFGHDTFIFEVHNVYLENITFIGDSQKNHSVRLFIKGKTHRFRGIYWNGWPILEKLQITPQTAVNIVFKFQESFYKGQSLPQISLLDVKIPENALNSSLESSKKG